MLNEDFKAGVFESVSLTRQGSSLPPAADGQGLSGIQAGVNPGDAHALLRLVYEQGGDYLAVGAPQSPGARGTKPRRRRRRSGPSAGPTR